MIGHNDIAAHKPVACLTPNSPQELMYGGICQPRSPIFSANSRKNEHSFVPLLVNTTGRAFTNGAVDRHGFHVVRLGRSLALPFLRMPGIHER